MRSHTGRGAFAWAWLVPALAQGQPASNAAAPGALTLRWSDPSGLSPTTEGEFEARLSERLGHPAFDHQVDDHALVVSWQGTAEQCQVELQLAHGAEIEGTRLLESPSGDCQALDPALLTIAALLIESRASEPAPEVAKPSPPPPHLPPASPPIPAKIQPQQPPFAMLSMGAQVSSGLTPTLELGPAASLVFAPVRAFRVGALGSIFFPRQYGESPGFSLGHINVVGLICGMPISGALGLGVCGTAAVQRWSSSGISLPHPESHHVTSWTTGASVRGEWRLTRHLWWVGSVGADVVTQPLYFYYAPPPGGRTVVFRQARVTPSASLGLTLELP